MRAVLRSVRLLYRTALCCTIQIDDLYDVSTASLHLNCKRFGDLGSVPTAECLWQAKHAKSEFCDAITDKMLMVCLEKRLTPTFRTVFEEHERMILVVDIAAYHRGCNEEVKVP